MRFWSAGAEGKSRAYRLSTIRSADKIIALEKGRIREVGDHQELLARGGLYNQSSTNGSWSWRRVGRRKNEAFYSPRHALRAER